jgi:hypothetical protein
MYARGEWVGETWWGGSVCACVYERMCVAKA